MKDDAPTTPLTAGLLDRMPQAPRKVALLRASRIGDFICATPAIRALRAALPEAEISMITLPLLRELVERSPYLDRFLPFPGFPGIAEQFFEARKATAFFAQMQREEFDLAIQMQGSGVYSNPFTLLLGARFTAGFIRAADRPGRLDAALPLPDEGLEVERVLALVHFLGLTPCGLETEYPLLPADHRQAEALLAPAAAPYIGLHSGAWDETRRWPVERFIALGHALQRRYGGTIVLLGGAMEQRHARQALQTLGERCLNLVGKTTLGTLGAVISRLALLVGNDSGPAHVGYALACPTVTICRGHQLGRYRPPLPGPFRMVTPPQPGQELTHVTPEQVQIAVEDVIAV